MCKRGGGGELAEGGGDGVDDVAEHLFEAGEVVSHRPQLPVQHRALHSVARSKSPSKPGCSGNRLHLHNLPKLLSHHEAHSSIGQTHGKVGKPVHRLPSLVSLTNKPLNTAGVFSRLVICPV